MRSRAGGGLIAVNQYIFRINLDFPQLAAISWLNLPMGQEIKMNAADYLKRARWLRAVAKRMDSGKAAAILRECADDMAFKARRADDRVRQMQ